MVSIDSDRSPRAKIEYRNPWVEYPNKKPRPVSIPDLSALARAGSKGAQLLLQIPYAFLKWNEGAIGQFTYAAGEILCREGENAATAFFIESGEIEVVGRGGEVIATREPKDLILGEMACLNATTRNATLRAKTRCDVLVVRRNVLHVLQRSRLARKELWGRYGDRALEVFFRGGSLFAGLDEQLAALCLQKLQQLTTLKMGARGAEQRARRVVEFMRFAPGDVIVRQGTKAYSLYVVYSGLVKVSEDLGDGREFDHNILGAGRQFGEIAVMSEISPQVAARMPGGSVGLRTATCTALNHVMVIRIRDVALKEIFKLDPRVERHLVDYCLTVLDRKRSNQSDLKEFSQRGFQEGRDLLTIDLTRCTRCQECVRACEDAHPQDRVARLALAGPRYDRFLVPFACRSCHDPACLVGCPVDAIHRPLDARRSALNPRAIVIEDYCIGCGLCAEQCPFDSIDVWERRNKKPTESPTKAYNCDLCTTLDGNPRCVHACPHDAAHRGVKGFDFADLLGLKILGPSPSPGRKS